MLKFAATHLPQNDNENEVSAFYRRLSTVFFTDSETNGTIPLHFRNVFHFFSEKTL